MAAFFALQHRSPNLLAAAWKYQASASPRLQRFMPVCILTTPSHSQSKALQSDWMQTYFLVSMIVFWAMCFDSTATSSYQYHYIRFLLSHQNFLTSPCLAQLLPHGWIFRHKFGANHQWKCEIVLFDLMCMSSAKGGWRWQDREVGAKTLHCQTGNSGSFSAEPRSPNYAKTGTNKNVQWISGNQNQTFAHECHGRLD